MFELLEMKPKLKNKRETAFERKEYIKPSEFENFIKTIPYKDEVFKLMFKIGYYIGLRPIEYRNIELEDINFQNSTLAVRLAKTNKIKIRDLPKKLTQELKDYISRNRHRFINGFIFIGYNANPYELNTIERKFRFYAKKCNWLEPYKVESSIKVLNLGRVIYQKRLYSLRVSFITNMYLIYEDIKKVSKIIGHELSKTTEGYIKNIIFDEDLKINELYENGSNIINQKIQNCRIETRVPTIKDFQNPVLTKNSLLDFF